jgi:hypothetical protein
MKVQSNPNNKSEVKGLNNILPENLFLDASDT